MSDTPRTDEMRNAIGVLIDGKRHIYPDVTGAAIIEQLVVSLEDIELDLGSVLKTLDRVRPAGQVITFDRALSQHTIILMTR